jgi:hypothetical protein
MIFINNIANLIIDYIGCLDKNDVKVYLTTCIRNTNNHNIVNHNHLHKSHMTRDIISYFINDNNILKTSKNILFYKLIY